MKNNIHYKNKAIALIYHHISSTKTDNLTITPERFESDLKSLKDNEFNIISLSQMLNGMYGKFKFPDNAVVITFDDGIESFYNYAYPLLKKYNMCAVNFIITSRTEGYKTSKALSPNEITEMYKSGIVDIQSHTHRSHYLEYVDLNLKQGGVLANRIYNSGNNSYESEEAYMKRVTDDLKKSREIIYKYIGVYAEVLCFPFGHYNEKVISIAEACGFKYFVTINEGCNEQNSMCKMVLRINVGGDYLATDTVIKNIINCANGLKI